MQKNGEKPIMVKSPVSQAVSINLQMQPLSNSEDKAF